MATALYCTLNDVANVLSSSGVDLRVDDGPPDPAGDVLDDASRTIDEYALLAYSEANLALSPWVMHATKIVAAVYLCERRGNTIPRSIEKRYDMLMERLEKVRLGSLMIPDIPARADMGPQLINGRTVLAPVLHFRVQKARSMGEPTHHSQRVDRADFLDYVI